METARKMTYHNSYERSFPYSPGTYSTRGRAALPHFPPTSCPPSFFEKDRWAEGRRYLVNQCWIVEEVSVSPQKERAPFQEEISPNWDYLCYTFSDCQGDH